MVRCAKVLANSEESQKDKKPYPVCVSESGTLEVLASVDKVLASNSQSQSQVESGFEDIKVGSPAC